MFIYPLRAFVALIILLSVSIVYAHNKVVVIPLGGDDAPPPTAYAIGDTGPAGGVVFYVTNGGLHGLEAAPADSANSPWGCVGTTVPQTRTAFGIGALNTAEIVTGCVSAEVTAAEVANAFTLNGFSDWFLPSKDELYQLYLQRNDVGGFASNYYWSSSQASADRAWFQYFDVGLQIDSDKYNSLGVRAVRAF
jgi:hypothetical protein